MKKITFVLRPEYHLPIDPPSPASNFIPEWYRKGESFLNPETNLITDSSDSDKVSGMKGCMPFLDALTSGYFVTSWADIEFTKNDDDGVEFRYVEPDVFGGYQESPSNWEVIAERKGDLGHTIPRPEGYSNSHMVWQCKWGMKLPRGWSMLVTHPMNYFDLPFITMSGIMESDRFSPNGNMPFFIKKGFTGIIKKGTPVAQLIPIKRSSWISTSRLMNDYDKFLANSSREVNYGFYRSKVWVPKKYKAKYDKKK